MCTPFINVCINAFSLYVDTLYIVYNILVCLVYVRVYNGAVHFSVIFVRSQLFQVWWLCHVETVL